MKIGFVQTSALGDCLLATAVLQRVRESHPNDRITWLIFDQYRAVAAACPFCDDYLAWPLDPNARRQDQEFVRWREMMYYAERSFDLVVCPQIYPFHDWMLRQGVSMLDQMFEYAQVTCIEPVRPLTFNRYGVGIKCDVAVNSKSNTQRPLWSPDQWKVFADLLEPYVICDGDSMGMGLEAWHTTIAAASVYVGLDSGGTWLAATTNTPQIALYSSQTTCPNWLSGIKANRVKDDSLVTELIDADPVKAAKVVLEILKGNDNGRIASLDKAGNDGRVRNPQEGSEARHRTDAGSGAGTGNRIPQHPADPRPLRPKAKARRVSR